MLSFKHLADRVDEIADIAMIPVSQIVYFTAARHSGKTESHAYLVNRLLAEGKQVVYLRRR